MILSDNTRLSTYRCSPCQTDRAFGVGHTELATRLGCQRFCRVTRHHYVSTNHYLIEYEAIHEGAKGLLFTYSRLTELTPEIEELNGR